MLSRFALVIAGSALLAPAAYGGFIQTYIGPDGLAAEAEFDILGPRSLQVRLRNTSTGVPDGADSADQILTTIAWDFGEAGSNPLDPAIIGGSVRTGFGSRSLNFSIRNVGPDEDVSGEWGFVRPGAFGPGTNGGLMTDFFTATRAHAVPFGGENLDSTENIAGPGGGLVSDPLPIPLGGQGAIQDEVIAILDLDKDLANLDFLLEHGSVVEFGSDYRFVQSPSPGGMMLLVAAGLLRGRRRK